MLSVAKEKKKSCYTGLGFDMGLIALSFIHIEFGAPPW